VKQLKPGECHSPGFIFHHIYIGDKFILWYIFLVLIQQYMVKFGNDLHNLTHTQLPRH